MSTMRPSVNSKKISRPAHAASSSGWSSTMCEPFVPPMYWEASPSASLVRSVHGPEALTTTEGCTVQVSPPMTSRRLTPPSTSMSIAST